jgi:MHS family proline/betaine transporter-like MFS transporter
VNLSRYNRFDFMPPSSERPVRRGDIAAVSLGNALDWFEIVVYGYFAGVISTLFFPADTPGISLLLTFLTFGVTFVIRPLGAVVLGAYADRHGRKSAIQLSIVMMAAASAAIAFVPDYRSIGILAPCILVAARMIQGFAVGGEFGSATAFLAETDSARRGYFASWQFASQGLAAVLATGFGFVIATTLSDEQIYSWGWRLPFLFGLLIAPVGYYIRRRLVETMDFTVAPAAVSPVASIFAEHKQRLLAATGVIVLGSVATYTIVFMPTFAAHNLSLTASHSFAAALLTASIQMVVVPFVGLLSDRWGRLPISTVSAAAILVLALPMFVWLTHAPTLEKLLFVQVTLGVLTALYVGALPALMAELFPVRMRATGLSISYSVAVAAFGGFAPFVSVWLIEEFNSAVAPSYYLIAAAIVSLLSLLLAARLGKATG